MDKAERYKRALELEGKNQQQIAEKFRTSRQLIYLIINNKGRSKGHFGASKHVKEYLDGIVIKWTKKGLIK